MQARQVAWLVALAMVACGGRVEDGSEDPSESSGKEGASGSQGSGSEGGGNGDGSGSGVTCAAASPHPDYPYCYKASYPPCMAAGDERLAEKLSLTWQPKGGPWVGSSSDCRMLCCYGP